MKSLGHLVVFATGALCTLGAQQVYKNPEVKASIDSAREFVKSLSSKQSESEKSAEIEVKAEEVK
jgi:hypothetical protein